MKVKKQKTACVIENKWMMTSSTLMRPRRIINEELKVSKKSKTLRKKMSLKKPKVLRSNAFRVVSQLTRKKLMFKKQNNESSCTTSAESNNETTNNNDSLLNLLQVKDTQLKKAHTMVKECLEKTKEAEKKAEKVSSLELEVLKLKRELAETRSRDFSMLASPYLNESSETDEEILPTITPLKCVHNHEIKDESLLPKKIRPYSCNADILNTSERGKMFLLNASLSIDRLKKTCMEASRSNMCLKKS